MYEDLFDIRVMDNANLAIRVLDVKNIGINLPCTVNIDNKPYVLTNNEQYSIVPVKNAAKYFKKHSDNIIMSVLSRVGLNKYKYGVIVIGDSILFNHPALTFVLNKDTFTIYRQHMCSIYYITDTNITTSELHLKICSERVSKYTRNDSGTDISLFLMGCDDYISDENTVLIKRVVSNVIPSRGEGTSVFNTIKTFEAIQRFYIVNKFSSVNDLIAGEEDDWDNFVYATGSRTKDDEKVLALLKEDGYEI